VNSLPTKFFDDCRRTVHPVRRKRVTTAPPPGVSGLAVRFPRRSADSLPVAHCCCRAVSVRAELLPARSRPSHFCPKTPLVRGVSTEHGWTLSIPWNCALGVESRGEGGAGEGSAGKEWAGTAPSLARPRPISSMDTRERCLLAPAGAGGRERVSAAAAARAGNAGREASGCENYSLSSHPPPRSGRNLPLLVGCTMVFFHLFIAPLGVDLVLSTAPV